MSPIRERGLSPPKQRIFSTPSYCGRQAGRGLGLGLPRAARIAELAGATLRWSSTPGHGMPFQIQIPVTPRPDDGEPVLPFKQSANPK